MMILKRTILVTNRLGLCVDAIQIIYS